jgi:hypothetical protein
MAEWGMEELLLEFGRDTESVLGENGVQRPKHGEQWVDVLSNTKGG